MCRCRGGELTLRAIVGEPLISLLATASRSRETSRLVGDIRLARSRSAGKLCKEEAVRP